MIIFLKIFQKKFGYIKNIYNFVQILKQKL